VGEKSRGNWSMKTCLKGCKCRQCLLQAIKQARDIIQEAVDAGFMYRYFKPVKGKHHVERATTVLRKLKRLV